jgi:DNA-binding response OmpR family regulator
MRVLIVDDDVNTLEVIQIYLGEFKKVYVEVAQGVNDALPLLKSKPDVLLLDYLLHHETCERIIIEARMRYNPFICVMTAARNLDPVKLLRAQIILKKPFVFEDLDKILLM